MASYKKNKKGGFVSYYANASTPNDYMLYNKDLTTTTTATTTTATPQEIYYPPSSGTTSTSLYAMPNMSGGGKKNCDNYKDCDAFEFDNYDSFLYSLKGGCACNSSSLSGGNNSTKERRNGGAFALTPYITAISLLAARLLTDKNIGVLPMKGGNELKKNRNSRNK